MLRSRIAAAKIPSSSLDETINLATWNIREFGKKPRRAASLRYIAEILGMFDLIALVEVRDDLTDLKKVVAELGPYWSVVFSDYITDAGGNRERMAYVFDKRGVTFSGLASNVSPPRDKTKEGEYTSELSWWRPPYICSFRAGKFDFVLVTAHIRWGDSEKGRVPELTLLANWVDERRTAPFVADKDLVVMGDFNIPSLDSPLFKALTAKGLLMPKELCGVHGSDLAQGKRYDQILHRPIVQRSFAKCGGVLDFYCGDHLALYPGDTEATLSREKFTYELSDHLPLWLQVVTDVEDAR